jgi:hypothetical protein
MCLGNVSHLPFTAMCKRSSIIKYVRFHLRIGDSSVSRLVFPKHHAVALRICDSITTVDDFISSVR